MTRRPCRREPRAAASPPPASWSYEAAFCRNHGLISTPEQTTLRNTHVAIAGMGGVGGVHLLTLARLGIGKFTIADPDTFEVANFNRQCGATIRTLGKSKAEVMAAEAKAINPEAEIRVISDPIAEDNVTDFLAGTDLFLDGVDFFAIEARRLLFRTARELGLWGVTAGPIGFSTAWLNFDPCGMPFDRYFDINDRITHSISSSPSPWDWRPRRPRRAISIWTKLISPRARDPPSRWPANWPAAWLLRRSQRSCFSARSPVSPLLPAI